MDRPVKSLFLSDDDLAILHAAIGAALESDAVPAVDLARLDGIRGAVDLLLRAKPPAINPVESLRHRCTPTDAGDCIDYAN